MREGKYTYFIEKHNGLSCLRANPAWPKSYWAMPGPWVHRDGKGRSVGRPCRRLTSPKPAVLGRRSALHLAIYRYKEAYPKGTSAWRLRLTWQNHENLASLWWCTIGDEEGLHICGCLAGDEPNGRCKLVLLPIEVVPGKPRDHSMDGFGWEP